MGCLLQWFYWPHFIVHILLILHFNKHKHSRAAKRHKISHHNDSLYIGTLTFLTQITKVFMQATALEIFISGGHFVRALVCWYHRTSLMINQWWFRLGTIGQHTIFIILLYMYQACKGFTTILSYIDGLDHLLIKHKQIDSPGQVKLGKWILPKLASKFYIICLTECKIFYDKQVKICWYHRALIFVVF